ncbi:MAG: hypothetical protein CO126_07810, partial [Hydrogenophilales bacterium CG_4_9_14_3_um_filter_63_34]
MSETPNQPASPSRRDFFKMGGVLAAGAGVAVAGLTPAAAEAAINTAATLPYKHKTVARVKTMKVNQ